MVSVHDVTPYFTRQLKDVIALLDDMGIARASMLVVPNYHNRVPLKDDGEFVQWLGKLEKRGFEMVMHGFSHLEEKRARTMEERLHSSWSTRGEGEFLSLEYGEASEKIRRGRADLGDCGFDPGGFIAPAWLLNDNALEAVKDAGFRYTNTGLYFTVFNPPRRVCAPAVVLYGGKSRIRRRLGVLETWLRLRLLTWNRFARIAVHPVDMDIPVLKRAVTGLLARASESRTPITYEKMMELCSEPDTGAHG